MNLTNRKLPKWLWAGMGIAAMLFTAAVLVFYVLGPALATLHSDYTDSLLWANATAESGRVLDPKFNYAAILPFGGALWMVPILKIFGYGRTAYVLSMLVFIPLFMGAAYYMMRSLKFSRVWSAIGTMTICLILSSSQNMLEMMWAHVIYYSLSILFFMLAVSLTLRVAEAVLCWKRGDKISWKKLILLGLLAILCVGSATDGVQLVVMSTLPVMGGLIAMAFFDEKPLLSKPKLKTYVLVALMGVATLAGLVLLKLFTRNDRIDAVYANAYDYWSPSNQWTKNFMQLFPALCALFGVELEAGTKLFTVDSVIYVLKMAYLVLIILCPAVLLLRYKKLRQSTKLLIWAHLILSVVLFLGYVCGMLYTAQWRLIPFIGTGTILLIAALRELWGGKAVEKRLVCVLAAVMAVICLANVADIAVMPRRVEDNKHWALTQQLQERGYTHGYATFWNSHPVNILSDDQVHVGVLEQKPDGELVPRQFQNYKNEFDACPEGSRCFLVLDSYELSLARKSEYWTRLQEQRNLVDSFQCGDYYVLVFDGHVIV